MSEADDPPNSGTPTVRVVEEFLLLDPVTGLNRAVADQVIAALPGGARTSGRSELRRSTIELVSPGCSDLTELRGRLIKLRRSAADAADDAQVRLVAIGATPVGETDLRVADRRYRAVVERFGPVALEPAVCGLQVHVAVADRETAVQVCNHLQAWLPVIRALTGNSPVFQGTDTGYASWRAAQLLRWPVMGPTPWFASAGDYDRTVAELIASGAVFDEDMVYWYARPGRHDATVEIRAGDVGAEADDSLLAVALTRAAVATAITAQQAGRPPARERDCVLTAAHWRAARDGLTHTLLDTRLGRTRPAWDLVNEFFASVSPALLAAGDLDLVLHGLARLRRLGDGATRQRALYERAGDLHEMLAVVAEQTLAE